MNILVTHPIDPAAVRVLRSRFGDVRCAFRSPADELRALVRRCDILIFRSSLRITAQFMEDAMRLRLLIRAGTGCDNVDTAYLQSRGLKLLRVPVPRAAPIVRAIEQFHEDGAATLHSVGLHAGLDGHFDSAVFESRVPVPGPSAEEEPLRAPGFRDGSSPAAVLSTEARTQPTVDESTNGTARA